MRTKSIVTLALLVFVAQGAAAQDVRAVLQAVAQNIGADRLTTLEISGAGGFAAAPGGSHNHLATASMSIRSRAIPLR